MKSINALSYKYIKSELFTARCIFDAFKLGVSLNVLHVSDCQISKLIKSRHHQINNCDSKYVFPKHVSYRKVSLVKPRVAQTSKQI